MSKCKKSKANKFYKIWIGTEASAYVGYSYQMVMAKSVLSACSKINDKLKEGYFILQVEFIGMVDIK